LGYRFRYPSATLKESSDEDLKAITEVESRLGRLPLIARIWYQRLSSVNFEQDHSQLYNRTGLRPEIAGLGLNTVLIFRSLLDCLALRSEMSKEVQEAGDSSNWLTSFLPFGGYASNSNPKGLHLAAEGVDAPIYNDGGGDIYFVEELRTAFAWGGFPFWRHLIPGSKQHKNRSPLGFSPDFAPILANLAEGLLEI